jgi:hypothetical protein
MMCYLWVHKKVLLPYLGIVEGKHINHPNLIIEKRARMKILLIDPEKDLQIETIDSILKDMLLHQIKNATLAGSIFINLYLNTTKLRHLPLPLRGPDLPSRRIRR